MSCLWPAPCAFLRVLAPRCSSPPRGRSFELRLHPQLLPAVPSGVALPLLVPCLSAHPSSSLVWQRMRRLKSLATACIILLCLGDVFAVSGTSIAFRSCTKLASASGQTVQNHLFPCEELSYPYGPALCGAAAANRTFPGWGAGGLLRLCPHAAWCPPQGCVSHWICFLLRSALRS